MSKNLFHLCNPLSVDGKDFSLFLFGANKEVHKKVQKIIATEQLKQKNNANFFGKQIEQKISTQKNKTKERKNRQ